MATWKLYEYGTGEVVKEFDVSGMGDREKERLFDGMVMKIDFEKYGLDRGEDDA